MTSAPPNRHGLAPGYHPESDMKLDLPPGRWTQ